MHLPKQFLQPVTWLIPAAKPDTYNPESLIPDWTQPPTEKPLKVTWLNQPARLTDDAKRSLVAWSAQIGIAAPRGTELHSPALTLRPGERIRRESDETVWHIISVTPASTSPFTGCTSSIIAELELPVG